MASGNGGPEAVLVIDDDVDTRESLQLFASLHGQHAIAVGCGTEALRVLAATPHICAVILDFVMPGNGQKFLQQLREQVTSRNIPVIVATGCRPLPEMLINKLGLVPERCLLKPVDPRKLLQLARMCCSEQH